MNHDEAAPTLTACDADGRPVRPALQRVEIHARLQGLLLDLHARQHWRHTGSGLIEVAYTFPVPPGAVLLGVALQMAGRHLASRVVAADAAERGYEQALAEGDAPLLVQPAGDGLYTLNLGNLKPGDDLVVDVHWAQVQAVHDGRLRIAVPTTVAPRYGSPAGAGLQPHQVPVAALDVAYPLSLVLDIDGPGPGGAGRIECATHAVQVQRTAAGARVMLGGAAWLDRDVVITVQPPAGQPAAAAAWAPLGAQAVTLAPGGAQAVTLAPEGAQAVTLAALTVPAGPPRTALAVKLLVDCSGSMGGDSIASARRALVHIARRLGGADRVGFTRFGSEVQHGFPRMVPARGSAAMLLQALIGQTDATLGGTELESALDAVFALPGAEVPADVLLITDGEVWQADAVVHSPLRRGQRVFAIGVGASPAASLLGTLAEATGGACEFATPGEDMEAAVDRMLARMRQGTVHAPTLQGWDAAGRPMAPDWVAGLPGQALCGDTLVTWAAWPRPPARLALMAAPAAGGRPEAVAQALVPALAASPVTAVASAAEATLHPIVRMAGNALLRQARARGDDARTQQALALAYGLVCEHTAMLAVHARAAHDKAEGFAALHAVPQMLAAGWGGMGRVAAAAPADLQYSVCESASLEMLSPARDAAAPWAGAAAGWGPDMAVDLDDAAHRKAARGLPPAAHHALARVLQAEHQAVADWVQAALPGRDRLLQLLVTTGAGTPGPAAPDAVQRAQQALVDAGLPADAAAAVVLRWLAEQWAIDLTAAADAQLELATAALGPAQWADATAVLAGIEALAAPAAAVH